MYKKYVFFLIMLILVCVGCVTDKADNEEEKIWITRSGLWPRYTLESGVSIATTIVYGEVIDKGDAIVVETPQKDGRIVYDSYEKVTIEVTEWIKGEKTWNNQYDYKELGGGNEVVNITYDDDRSVEVGDWIIVYMLENGTYISPAGLFIADDDGNIRVSSDMMPLINGERPEGYTTISIEEYCALIVEAAKNPMPISEDSHPLDEPKG